MKFERILPQLLVCKLWTSKIQLIVSNELWKNWVKKKGFTWESNLLNFKEDAFLGSSSILNFWYLGEWESSKAHCLSGIYLQIKFISQQICLCWYWINWIKYIIISIGVDLSIRMIVLWWFNYTVYLGGQHLFLFKKCRFPWKYKV